MNMPPSPSVTVRPAVPDDARVMARLIDIAGEGIPHYLWAGMAGRDESPLDVGENRAKRESGGFSYRHAQVAEIGGIVVGMVLGYPLAEPTAEECAAVAELPEPIRPFVELEHMAVGTFYINALAVFPGHRGAGIGTRLLDAAEQRARGARAGAMSIQVYSWNLGALRLYERIGFVSTAERPVLDHPGRPCHDDRVLLLQRDV